MNNLLGYLDDKDDVKSVKKKKRHTNPNLGKDEAALKIQKQYRGYRVRKDYALDGKKYKTLDEKTLLFMKAWGKKWKAKSMFQVLLLYRAQRLQDLTYFCQQVHIYNQNIAGVLMGGSKKSVPLDKIKPGRSVRDFLGPMKPPSINKVPFRYNDVMKFDPMEPKGSAFGDDEAWDEPLKRGRHQGPKDKHYAYRYRDQEVQTANLDSPEVAQTLEQLGNRDTCPEELNFIDTPYTRDPKSVRNMYSDQKYRNKYNTPKKARAPSPPKPMSRTKVPVSSYEDSSDLRVPPARAPPPPPTRHTEPRQEYSSRESDYSRSDRGDVSKSNNVNNYNSKISQPAKYTPKGAPVRENNPVHELQMLAQQGNRNDSEDDPPPFNFQAMLRKTDTNRESLRRVRRNNNSDDMNNGNSVNTTTYNNMDNRGKHNMSNGRNNMANERSKHDSKNGFTRGTQDINDNNYERGGRNGNRSFSNNQRGYNETNQTSFDTNGYGRDSQTKSYSRQDRNYSDNQRGYNETSFDTNGRNNQNQSYSRQTYDSKPEYQRTNSNDLLIQSRNNLNRTQNGYVEKIIRTELAPGIILEGIEVDL